MGALFEELGGTYDQEGDCLLPNLTPPGSVPYWHMGDSGGGNIWERIKGLSAPPCFFVANGAVVCPKLILRRKTSFHS